MRNNIKHGIHFLTSKNRRKNILEKLSIRNELKRISLIPRYTRFPTNIFGTTIEGLDAASFVFMYREIFETKIYQFNSNNPNPLIVDCGTNIGLSVIYFKKLFPGARIITFEPDHEIFEVAQKNFSSLALDKVEFVNNGLWHNEGIISFNKEGADGGSIALEDQNSDYSINVTRLSNYLKEAIDFLKIDIEGAETAVLEECAKDLKNVKKIFVEYHSFIGEPQSIDKIMSILTQSGFRIYLSTPGLHSERPFMYINTYNNMDLQVNIFGIRE